MLNMTFIQKMIEQTRPGGPVLFPSPALAPPLLHRTDELDWLNQSEFALERLLADCELAASKTPRFLSYDGRVNGPASTEFWSNESGRVATSRKITNVRSTKVIGFTHSFSMGASLANESTLEAEAERLFDWASSTVSVHPQPPRIKYTFDGVLHSTTPDLLVVTANGRYLVEVKPLKKALEPMAIRRFEAIQQGAAALQLSYFVATERILCADPRRSNIMKLRRHALYPVDRLEAARILTLVPDAPASTTLGELHAALGDDADRLVPTLGSLIYWHVVRVNINAPLDDATLLWKRPEVLHV